LQSYSFTKSTNNFILNPFHKMFYKMHSIPQIVDEDLAIDGPKGEGGPVGTKVDRRQRVVRLDGRHGTLHLDVVANAPLVQARRKHQHLNAIKNIIST
jgi:hypothetical protein